MSSIKMDSVIKIAIKNTAGKNILTKIIYEVFNEFHEKDKGFANFINERGGIDSAALKKKMDGADSAGNIAYAVAEAESLLSEEDITEELISKCKHKCENLYHYLWQKYEDRKKDNEIEYKGDIQCVLYIIAKGYIESERKESGFAEKLLVEIAGSIADMKEEMNSHFASLEEKFDGTFAQGKRNGSTQAIDEQISKEISIYLAASDNECREYIDSLNSFITQLNSELRDDVHITLFYGIDDPGEEKKIIQNCKYYYMLVKTMAERRMQESYEFAYDQYCGSKIPAITVFFKNLSEAESELSHKSLEEFRDKYRENSGVSPIMFDTIDTIKLHIILDNLNLIKSGRIIPQLEENSIRINENMCFSLDSIPQFQTNTTYAQERKKLDDLQAEYDTACNVYYNNSNKETRQILEQAKEELKEQRKIVSRLIKDIWDNMAMMADKSQNRKVMDGREAEAVDCISKYNDYEGAKLKLEDLDWKEDIIVCTHLMENRKEKEEKKVLQYISGQRLLISIWKIGGINSESQNEIIQIYEFITELSQKWRTEYNTLYEYAEFLLNQRKYIEGLEICKRLMSLYTLDKNISSEDKAKAFVLMGQLYYWTKEYGKAKENYEQAVCMLESHSLEYQELILEINLELAKLLWKTNHHKKAEEKFRYIMERLDSSAGDKIKNYQQMLAETYNHLAILAHKRKQLDMALMYHGEALKIRKKLADEHPSDEKGTVLKLSNTYNNLGVIYKKLGEYEKAVAYYKEALNIRRENAVKNPSVYRPAVALAGTNLAIALNLNGENRQAQELCQEALSIRRGLADENPAYRSVLAITLCEFGTILADAENYTRAEECFQESIKINKELIEEDKAAHRPALAGVYLDYGRMLVKRGKENDRQWNEKAEKFFKKALKTYHKFEKDNPSYYAFEIAETCDELTALLSQYPQKHLQAEEYCREAVKCWRILAEKCMRAYYPRYEEAKNSLAELTGNQAAIN